MRKKKYECKIDSGWEIALADLMTVLMVFFLVMWLTSIISPDQRASFVDGFMGEGEGEGEGVLLNDSVLPEIIKIEVEKQPKPDLTTEEVAEALHNIKQKDINIVSTPEGIKITLRSDSFFESGRANVRDKIQVELENLGKSLLDRQQTIKITGFTDNIPIANFQFPSNWELSAARAATVARAFVDVGVDPNLITIQGRAYNDPVAKNTTAYGRSLNRRVIILVEKGQ